MSNQWTRERIIRHLVERQEKGLSLNAGRDGVDSLLYQAARRIFGSWRIAIQAAGIAPERVLTWDRWPPAKILMIIRRLAQRDRPLSGAEMERRYGSMMSAARRFYGSWTKAVLAAGVDPTRLQRVVPWNQDRVIEGILTRTLRNESLVPGHIEPRSLVVAGERLFGSWAAAVTAAGLDPKAILSPPARARGPRPPRVRAARVKPLHQPHQLWTKDLVIAAIQERVRKRLDLNARAMAREDCALYRAGRRHLKTWCNALREAGLDPAEHQLARRRKDPSPTPAAETASLRPSQASEALRPDRPT